MTDPGWYYADGDPAHTERYWDGTQWVGQPVYDRQQSTVPQAVPPGAPGQVPTPGKFRHVAEPGTRMGARIIDVLIIFGFLVALVLTDIGGTPDAGLVENSDFGFRLNDRAFDTPLEFFILAVFGFVWNAAWIHLKGGTPGKLMVGIRIADEASAQVPVNLQQAALRASNYLLPVFGLISNSLGSLAQTVGFLIALVSLILLFTDDRHRTVMDRIAKTLVVRN